MLPQMLLSVLVLTACSGGAFKGSNKKKPSEPVVGNVTLKLEYISASALYQNCLYYSIGDEPLALYGCNHGPATQPMIRTINGLGCIKANFELRTHHPVNMAQCIAKTKIDANADCEFENQPASVAVAGSSAGFTVTNSKDDKTRTYAFEDSKDNDRNDYIFSITTTSSFCPVAP
jgi:hypothetical protein